MAQPIPVTLTQVDAASYKGGTPVPLQVIGNVPGGDGGGGPADWSDITGKPTVIASGENQAEARSSIGAASTSEIPTKSSLGLGNVDNTSDAEKSIKVAQISDSGATGKNVVLAVTQAAARTAIGLGDNTVSPTGAPFISLYNNSDQATLHLTASGAFNAPYIVGIGNDVGNKYGLLVSNKAAGVGAVFNNAATVTAADGYALRVTNASTASPGALFEATGANAGVAVRITTDTAASITARRLMQWAGQPGGTYTVFGEVWGDGTFNWASSARFRGNIGFFNTAPIAKPTVSGSLASGAATTSLLAALASLGLITNSTTA